MSTIFRQRGCKTCIVEPFKNKNTEKRFSKWKVSGDYELCRSLNGNVKL